MNVNNVREVITCTVGADTIAGVMDVDMDIAGIAGIDMQRIGKPGWWIPYVSYSGKPYSNPILGPSNYAREWYRSLSPEMQGYVGAQIPFVGDWQKMQDQARFYQDYYEHTGVKPKYPSLNYGNFGTALAYSALGMASHAGVKAFNPNKLYR